MAHLLIIDDLIFHYGAIGPLWTLPGQCHAVLAPPLLQHNTHCIKQDKSIIKAFRKKDRESTKSWMWWKRLF